MRFTTTIAAAMVMAASQAKITIDPATRTFRDDQNRHVIMHGQNVVVKLPNYLPTTESFDWQTSISDEDLQLLQDWGTNIIRLGVMWESVETAPGVYDYDYLNSVDELINRFGAYGMNVIVDNHQDLFSRSLCGEGVPHFYTPEDLDRRCPNTILGFAFKMAGECKPFKYYDVPMGEDGLPVPEECTKRNFEDMYTMPEVASAFAALYDNKDGLLDKMMDFWSVVAEKYASNEHVMGYDIFNEPWPANLYREPSLFFKPGKFDHEKLFPLTVRAHETVRAKDDEKIIFVEPAQFPDTLPFLGGRIEHIGFKSTPGGEDYLNRQSLNDHSYCC
mmetsp:Transcript_44313/g.60113  ORF Transcript_44313/g.60113 Transcript_44313/m.60113 type:complete len:332 (+) Transcript_44313:61-1056(+)